MSNPPPHRSVSFHNPPLRRRKTDVCVTWGALKPMTWAWWATYAEEAYALLSPDWMRATGTDPAGVDWATLAADMRTLAA